MKSKVIDTSFSCIGGTKSSHKAILKTLNKVRKEDKIGKRKAEFTKVKNGLGKEVRQGKIKIVKAEPKITEKLVKAEPKISLIKENPLQKLLKGIK